MSLDVVQDEEGCWVSKYLHNNEKRYELCGHCAIGCDDVLVCPYYPKLVDSDTKFKFIVWACSKFESKG